MATKKSVFSYLRTLTTWHCPHSPAAAASIDRYLLSVWPTAANLQQRRAAAGWERQTNGRTDGRTPDRYMDPAPRTMLAASIINSKHCNSDCFSAVMCGNVAQESTRFALFNVP